MNNNLKIGLLLQIPNVIIFLSLGFYFLMPYLFSINSSTLIYILVGTGYSLLNIASIILIASGFGKQ